MATTHIRKIPNFKNEPTASPEVRLINEELIRLISKVVELRKKKKEILDKERYKMKEVLY